MFILRSPDRTCAGMACARPGAVDAPATCGELESGGAAGAGGGAAPTALIVGRAADEYAGLADAAVGTLVGGAGSLVVGLAIVGPDDHGLELGAEADELEGANELADAAELGEDAAELGADAAELTEDAKEVAEDAKELARLAGLSFTVLANPASGSAGLSAGLAWLSFTTSEAPAGLAFTSLGATGAPTG